MSVYPRYKCPVCGWVHIGLPREEVEERVHLANEHLKSLNLEKEYGYSIDLTIESYMKCSRCGGPSKDFIPAEEGDAPPLATLQAVIAPETKDH